MNGTDRIAVYGGTFDPFHRGHIEPVLGIYERFGWTRLIYVPAFQQPFKVGKRISSPFHRYAMTLLGTEGDPRIEVSLIELDRAEVSYTVDTLERIRRDNPAGSVDWIIGDDNLSLLPEWKSIDRIFELANFVVLSRGSEPALPAALAARVHAERERGDHGSIVFVRNPIVPISSTAIRSSAARGESLAGLVDTRVESYLQKYRLYGEAN